MTAKLLMADQKKIRRPVRASRGPSKTHNHFRICTQTQAWQQEEDGRRSTALKPNYFLSFSN